MKFKLETLGIFLILQCCDSKPTEQQSLINLEGTWQLISGTIIEKGDTTFTDYTKVHRMIKVINKTHFSFLNHDLKKGKDSTTLFIAGGGRYDLVGDQYTEHLEYCSDRMWEGNDFQFTVKIKSDTLTQSGLEKIEGTAVNRINIEKYVRLKK
ncbi:MAG TPA: hypothetical protein VGQ59_08105 [Cyclobacteriaceae bacterium]|jgi:hypothetical protein|nr:hypothetical protein [Cyclobacteriaceae bacterium]